MQAAPQAHAAPVARTAHQRPSVITLSRVEFRSACANLMTLAERDGRPDMIVGIPTGGMYVAVAMLDSLMELPVYPVRCRRPSTRRKQGSAIKSLVANLPRPVADRMRLIEHAMLTARATSAPESRGYRIDEEQLDSLGAAMRAAGPHPSVLVVDDAVDTGATLAMVMEAVDARAPSGARIRSAAIVQTTVSPLISPDYVLYHNQLCRFPWSLDAAAMNRS